MDRVKSGIHYVFSSYKRTAAVLIFAAVVLSIPVTISFLGNNQDIRQRASGVCANVPADIMLVIDRSQSMSGSAISSAKSAAKSFVDIVAQNADNRIGLVTFSSNDRTRLESPLTNSFSSVKTKIDSISVTGETCTQCGVKEANDEITAHKRAGIKNVVILLTDGRANAVIDNNSGSFDTGGSSGGGGGSFSNPTSIPTLTPTRAIPPSSTPTTAQTGGTALCQSYATHLQELERTGICTRTPSTCDAFRNLMRNAGCTLGASTSNVLGTSSMLGLRGEDAAAQAALNEVVAGNTQNQTVYFTIGLGSNVSTDFLQRIATATGGKYYAAPNASDLAAIYQDISQIVGKGSISGTAYNDANSNGAFDSGEAGIPNLSFTLETQGGTPQTATTDATGGFSFTGLCDASYNLKEQPNNNWHVTVPTNNLYTIPLTNGTSITGKDFANEPGPAGTTPTLTATPTPASSSGTLLNIALQLPGIGFSSSDSARLGINSSPRRPARQVQVTVFNSQNQQVASSAATATFEAATGQYKGTVNLGNNFTSGNYLVKARADNTLWKTAPGIVTINADQTNTAPLFSMVSGDFDQDNQITLLDYNMFITCIKTNSCKNVQ